MTRMFGVLLTLLLSVAAAQSPAAPGGYSAAALYNAANDYARSGKPGLAVLNYERAKLLDPRDPDIEANLRNVRLKARVPAGAPGPAERLAALIDPDALLAAGLGGLLVAGLCLVWREKQTRHRGKLLAASILGFGLIGVTLACGASVWPTLHSAVVVGHSVPARVSPTLIEEPVFDLPEAEVVIVSAEHDGFYLVKTSAGRTGWAPSANLALIVPRR